MKKVIIEPDNIQNTMYKEWLVTNGIGGFACGSICGAPRRKYHSLLTAALPAPYGRTIMLNFVADKLISSKQKMMLSLLHFQKEKELPSFFLTKFRTENNIPIWTFENEGIAIEKSLFFIHRQNTLCLSYKILSSPEPLELKWRPYLHFRLNDQAVNVQIPNESYCVHAKDFEYEIECPNFPNLKIFNDQIQSFTIDPKVIPHVYYPIEEERGYESVGSLTSPGYFSIKLVQNQRTTFKISTESWETIHAIPAKEAWWIEGLRKKNLLKLAGDIGKIPITAKLVLAADQFIMTPKTRYQDMIRLQATGEEVRSIIAGFPWFTDWGRDTMISLEGLTLVTGRYRDAYAILHTFAHYVKNGLIPNMFPDGQSEGIYNTADATLWFFHAISRYIEYTHDEEIIEFLMPTLHEIIHSHQAGTLYGIKVDEDGLLIQGQENFQLTWMDAKVGDWVVTPRRGKAVEINALWYNALKLYEQWIGKPLEITERCYESFNKKFWFEETNYLYDVIEGENGNDSSLRPNQLFAISLKYPVLKEDKWKFVLESVRKDLLTPVGLRTLSPNHPDYKAYYNGDLRSRDASYHQGTVWPWLLGPYLDVWHKVYPYDLYEAHKILKGMEEHLNSNCFGTVAEICDASPPYLPRGCFAQAWSVAEYLRSLVKILPRF